MKTGIEWAEELPEEFKVSILEQGRRLDKNYDSMLDFMTKFYCFVDSYEGDEFWAEVYDCLFFSKELKPYKEYLTEESDIEEIEMMQGWDKMQGWHKEPTVKEDEDVNKSNDMNIEEVIGIVEGCDTVGEAVGKLSGMYLEEPLYVQSIEAPTAFKGEVVSISVVDNNLDTVNLSFGDAIWDNKGYLKTLVGLSPYQLEEEGLPNEICIDVYAMLNKAKELGWLD